MAIHLWTLGLLVIVIIIYVVLTKLGSKKASEKIVKTTPKDDFSEWMFYLSKAFIYTFVMIGHLFRWIKDILATFVSWYKDKKQVKVKEVPRSYLWCPRCQDYFNKSHICFRGANVK